MIKNLHIGAIASFLGFTVCGLAYFDLHQALDSQRIELREAREQRLALDRALANQRHDLSEAQAAIIAVVNDKFAEAQTNYQALNQQLTELQSKLRDMAAAGETHVAPQPIFNGPAVRPAMPADVAAADSFEGKLRAEGRQWKRTQGPIVVGSYVEDVFKERAGQPKGRGWIGKVTALSIDGDGIRYASVDFGRVNLGFIRQTELAPIDFEVDAR